MDRHYEALRMHLEGKTYTEIGKKLGITKERARQLIDPGKKIRDNIASKTSWRCQKCRILIPSQVGDIHEKGNEYIGKEDPRADNFKNPDTLEYLCFNCHRQKHAYQEKPKDRLSLGNPGPLLSGDYPQCPRCKNRHREDVICPHPPRPLTRKELIAEEKERFYQRFPAQRPKDWVAPPPNPEREEMLKKMTAKFLQPFEEWKEENPYSGRTDGRWK